MYNEHSFYYQIFNNNLWNIVYTTFTVISTVTVLIDIHKFYFLGTFSNSLDKNSFSAAISKNQKSPHQYELPQFVLSAQTGAVHIAVAFVLLP